MISSIHAVYKHPHVDNVDFEEKIADELSVSPIHLSSILRQVLQSKLVRTSLRYHRQMTNNDLEAIIIAKLDDNKFARLENGNFRIVPAPPPAELPQDAEILHTCIDILDTAST